MEKRLFLLALLVFILLSSCNITGISRQPGKTSEIKLEILDFPTVVKHNQAVTFAVRTAPSNQCMSGIGYWSKDEWTTNHLPQITANAEGICQWNWTAPTEAQDGAAEFRVVVYQGSALKEIVPYQFCIEHCSK